MTQKVLIIDDDPAIHALVGLQMGSFQTIWFSAFDGASGLEMATTRLPDLIFLDVDMPGMHGHEVFRRLKSNPATLGIPVLFLTAAGSCDQKVQGLDLGAIDYITKPFDPFELRARTKLALRAKERSDLLLSGNMIDEVTGLFNRAYLNRQIHALLAQAQRWVRSLACILLEVDDLQKLGTELGRAGAEAVLRSVAGTLVQSCRDDDLVCRYGEGRFGIAAFSYEGEDAVGFADRVRKDIRSRTIHHAGVAIRITASCGVAMSRDSASHAILSEAENALRQAVSSGGDCVRTVCDATRLQCR